jgi:DNA-binding HxlR family transcriptional regulator
VARCPSRWVGFEHRTERIKMREGGAEKTGRRMGCMGAKDPTNLSARALNIWPVPEDVQVGYCESYQAAVELLGRRWNGAIVAVLLEGPRRYTQLALAVPGLSERLLTARLKELERAHVLIRRVIAGPPVGVEYELTDAGRELGPAIDAIALWARRWVETGRAG